MLLFFAWMLALHLESKCAIKTVVTAPPPCVLQYHQRCPHRDDQKFRECLQQKRAQLSPPCRDQVAPAAPISMDEVRYHCQKDVQAFCHRSPLDTFSCLAQQVKQKSAPLSAACQQAIKKWKG